MEDKGVSWPVYWQEISKLNSSDSPTGKLRISEFPSYLIIDKAGQVVNPNAPRPSDGDEIRQELDKYLSQE